jgi:hypothetical protein
MVATEPLFRFVFLSQPFGTKLSSLTVGAATRTLAVRAGVISPTYDLWQLSDPVDFFRFDSPWNDDLEAFRGFGFMDRSCGVRSRHLLVGLVVVTEPHRLAVRYAEVDPSNRSPPTPFQFTKPLMRDKEVPHHRHRVDAALSRYSTLAKPRNAAGFL